MSPWPQLVRTDVKFVVQITMLAPSAKTYVNNRRPSGLTGATRYGQKESVHVAVRSWISTCDDSRIDDVLPRKMLSQSGLGILARGIGNLWDRHHRQFESASASV